MITWTRGGVEYKAGVYKENLHPRDKNGRFIHIGGRVRISPIAGGGEGTVRANAGGGKIDVQRDNGTHVQVDSGYLEMLDAHPGGPGAPGGAPPNPAAAHLAEHGVPTVHVPQVAVPPLGPASAPEPAGGKSKPKTIEDVPSPWPSAKTGAEALAATPLSSYSDLPDEGLSGVPAEQIYQTLADYMAQGYSELNGDLRVHRGVTKNITRAATKKHVRAMDALMKNSKLKSDIVVFRGVRNPAAVLGAGWHEDNAVGAEWVDHSYASASTDSNIASRFTSKDAVVMRLHLPEGSGAIMLSQGKGESEILTDRGLTYKVTGDRKVGGVRLLDVEVTAGKRTPKKAVPPPKAVAAGTREAKMGTWRRGGIEYKATRFEEMLHPRDAHGRFITIGAHVKISPIIGGGEGTVRGTEHGLITVERTDGHRVNVARGYLTVTTPAERGHVHGASASAPAAPHAPAGPPVRPLAQMTAEAPRIPRNEHGDPLTEPEVRATPDGTLTLRTTSNVTGGKTTTEPLHYLYRVVSEEDYQRMLAAGVMDTAGHGNTARQGPDREGMVGSIFAGNIVELYASHDDGAAARLLKIEVRPGDGWRKHTLDGDTQADTLKPVPVDRIAEVSEPFTRDHVTENADGDTGFVRGSGYHPGDAAAAAHDAAGTPAAAPGAPAGSGRAGRPPMATPRRQTVAALGYDQAHPDPVVREAAAALRRNDPLTAPQALALAGAIRATLAADPKTKVAALTAERLELLAASLNAEDAALAGGKAAGLHLPASTYIPGQRVAVPEVPGRPYVEGTITKLTPRIGGQVIELEITDDATGRTETRQVLRDTPLRRLEGVPGPPSKPDGGGGAARLPREAEVGELVVGSHFAVMRRNGPVQGEVTAIVPAPGQPGLLRITAAAAHGGPDFVIEIGLKDRVTLLPAPVDRVLPGDTPGRITAPLLRRGDTIRMTNINTGQIQVRTVTKTESYGGAIQLTLMDEEGRETALHSGLLNVYELVDRPADPDASIAAKKDAAVAITARKVVTRALTAVDAMAIQRVFDTVNTAIAHGPADAGMTQEKLAGIIASHFTTHRAAHSGAAETAAVALDYQTEAKLTTADDRRLRTTLEAVQQAALTRLHDAVVAAEDDAAAIRLVLALGDPVSSHYQDAARRGDLTPAGDTLYRVLTGATASLAETLTAVPAVPNVRGPGSLRDRIALARAALGPGRMLGKLRVRRDAIPALTMEQLRTGDIPPASKSEMTVADRAADGGPGAVTMAQLEIVRAAGRAMDEMLQARIRARYGGQDQNDHLHSLNRKAWAAQDALDAVQSERTRAITAAEKAARAQLGYQTKADFEAALSELRIRAMNKQLTPALRAQLEKERVRLRDLVDNAGEPVRREYRPRITGAMSEVSAAKAARAAVKVNDVLREEALAVLADVRQMGGGTRGLRIKNPEHPATPDVLWAQNHYPAEWIDQADGTGLKLGTSDRGYYSTSKGELVVSRSQASDPVTGAGTYGEVAVHEIGHHMEQYVDGLIQMEEAYQWYRTTDAGTDVGGRTRTGLNDIRQLPAPYEPGETARRDTWPTAYSGKEYASGAWEIFTVGIQGLMAGRADGFLDDEYRQWVLGVMATL